MKRQRLLKVALCCLVMVLAVGVQAQPQGRGRGLYGDWLVKADFNGRTMESILSFGRDQDGNPTAQWISFWGVTDLQDVSLEDGKLSFKQVRQGRDGESMTSTFNGTIADGKLSGTMTGGRGEYTLTGERMPRTPWAVGQWNMSMKRDDREFNSTLTITADKDGTLKGTWKSERGQLDISNVETQRRTLTFTMKSTNPDRQWEATFEGELGPDGLTGVMKSERGEMAVTGTRVGGDLIGTWDLAIESDRGPRQQRLRINPDMSALYGAMPVEKLDTGDGKVGFKVTRSFGDRQWEMSLSAKLENGKLVGELTTPMGTQKFTGTKVVRRGRRPRPSM